MASGPLDRSREGLQPLLHMQAGLQSPVLSEVPPTPILSGSAYPTLRTEGQGHLSPRSRELSPREAQGVAEECEPGSGTLGLGHPRPPHAAHTPSLPAPADPGPALPLPLVPLRSVS